MKALSLTQPWASAVASGRKAIETRSWRTSYRGPLYIHAAKNFPPYARAFTLELLGNPAVVPYMPRGALVATAYLVDIRPTEEVAPLISSEELRLGDYSPGRWAWMLTNVEMLEPFPYKGALGLFEVNLP